MDLAKTTCCSVLLYQIVPPRHLFYVGTNLVCSSLRTARILRPALELPLIALEEVALQLKVNVQQTQDVLTQPHFCAVMEVARILRQIAQFLLLVQLKRLPDVPMVKVAAPNCPIVLPLSLVSQRKLSALMELVLLLWISALLSPSAPLQMCAVVVETVLLATIFAQRMLLAPLVTENVRMVHVMLFVLPHTNSVLRA
jgi:hypothetical protein